MQWNTRWLMINTCWIWLLMILSIYFLLNNRSLLCLTAAALAVVENDCLTLDPTRPSPAASFVIAVVSCNQVTAFGRLCMDVIYLAKLAITNAYITGMNELASYSSWSPRSLTKRCYGLLKGCVMARTPLSTKIRSDLYSDL